MLSNIIKSNQPIVLILIVLTGFLMWFNSFLNPIGMNIPSDTFNMPLYEILTIFLSKNALLSIIITFAFILLQALLLVQFNKKFIIINYRTYLPAFLYILIASSFVPLQRLNPVVFGMLFIYIAVYYIFGTYRVDFALEKLFTAGFFIAIASLFWAPFAVFFLLLLISLVILKPFIGREWMVGVLGFLTPLLFTFVYYFVFLGEEQLNALLLSIIENFRLIKVFNQIHFAYYIFYGFLATLIMFASGSIIRNYQKKKIRIRKFFEINWWLFFIGTVLFIFFRNVGYEVIFILSMPVSFLLTDYFYTIKRSMYLDSILFILIASIVYIQIIAHY